MFNWGLLISLLSFQIVRSIFHGIYDELGTACQLPCDPDSRARILDFFMASAFDWGLLARSLLFQTGMLLSCVERSCLKSALDWGLLANPLLLQAVESRFSGISAIECS